MRRAVMILMVVAILGPPLARVSAQQAEYPGESLLLIMDSSGSMNRVDDDGVALIDGAKQALRVLVAALPESAQVGLRVYGHRVPNTDKAKGCEDTELVIPVGPVDVAAMIEVIDSYDAVGFTPIGLSLREAVQDLPPTGTRTIVLVSDGIDTCAPPDPCEVAAELAAEGFNVRVHTVGLFLTDPAAEQQLQCIADATGG
ncbi:MAG: VWA domain-containing protein, partial [Acidimicrobiia bacterium]|nr:VWA domain-containing protein [Acidimicrobiia bacterium]